MKFSNLQDRATSFVLALILTSTIQAVAANSDAPESALEKELKLISILKSDGPSQEKAVPCKLLAVYGSRNAVPVLADLLSNPELASWARIALEAIPDHSVDDALRAAMSKLQGNLLVGVINSIGVRRDVKAVGGLITRLKDEDIQVVSAAALALGHIGGDKAAKALMNFLPAARTEVRSAVAEGVILCAEKMLANGKRKDAVKLYAAIRKADVPNQRMLEATRGEILARGPAGLALLLEQLRSSDKGRLAIGLHTARELPGREVTQALGAELHRATPDRQAFLLLALAERKDDAALPLVLESAKTGSIGLRLVAVEILDRQGNISSVPVLLEAAANNDAALSQAALTALARLPGNKVDSDLLTRLPQSSGKMRQVLIDLAAQRRIEAAIPIIVQSTEDHEAGVRNTSVEALGVLGSDKQVTDLVSLLGRTSDPKERANIEMALIGISERNGSACAAPLSPLAKNSDPALRIIALHTLASAGGPASLAAVRAAVEDNDESVRDEAVRTLSTWPNNWPDDAAVAEPLLALAKSGKSMSQQVLGMRGYLQYVKGDKGLKDEDKVSKVTELMPLLTRPEEKRLAIAVIDGIPTSAGLDLLMSFAAEPAIADDACSAILSVTGKTLAAVPKEQRQKALEAVVAKSNNGDTKKRAEELLRKNL